MKKVLLAFALQEEVVPVELPGCETVTCLTGISKPYAAARLARAVVEHRPDVIINVGSAGTQKWGVGDILVCTHFVDRDLARQGFSSVSARLSVEHPFAGKLLSVVGGAVTETEFVLNTGDDFVTAADVIEGDVIDMEGFADALVAQEFGVPFVAVKYVTDVVGQNSMQVWEERLAGAREGLEKFFRAFAEKLK